MIRLIARIWGLIGTEDNHRSITSIVQILGLIVAIAFGILGLRAVTEINVNLKDIKAESIQATRADLGNLNVSGNCDMRNDPNCRSGIRAGNFPPDTDFTK